MLDKSEKKMDRVIWYFTSRGIDVGEIDVDCDQCGWGYTGPVRHHLKRCGNPDCGNLGVTYRVGTVKYPPKEIKLSGKVDAAIGELMNGKK